MVEMGARSLIFLSRSAGQTDSDQQYFPELKSQGCQVTAISGKMDDKPSLERTFQIALNIIKGVFHLAMVLRDAAILDLSYED